MNWKEFDRKWSQRNLKYRSKICLEGLTKNINTLTLDSRCPCRDLNQCYIGFQSDYFDFNTGGLKFTHYIGISYFDDVLVMSGISARLLTSLLEKGYLKDHMQF
jgi:hypothetical protein